MNNFKPILDLVTEKLNSFPDWKNLEEFVCDFQATWLQLGQQVQQELVQQKIEKIEAEYKGPRTKRKKRYYTPRRSYGYLSPSLFYTRWY